MSRLLLLIAMVAMIFTIACERRDANAQGASNHGDMTKEQVFARDVLNATLARVSDMRRRMYGGDFRGALHNAGAPQALIDEFDSTASHGFNVWENLFLSSFVLAVGNANHPTEQYVVLYSPLYDAAVSLSFSMTSELRGMSIFPGDRIVDPLGPVRPKLLWLTGNGNPDSRLIERTAEIQQAAKARFLLTPDKPMPYSVTTSGSADDINDSAIIVARLAESFRCMASVFKEAKWQHVRVASGAVGIYLTGDRRGIDALKFAIPSGVDKTISGWPKELTEPMYYRGCFELADGFVFVEQNPDYPELAVLYLLTKDEPARLPWICAVKIYTPGTDTLRN